MISQIVNGDTVEVNPRLITHPTHDFDATLECTIGQRILAVTSGDTDRG